MLKNKEEITKERDDHLNEIVRLREQLAEANQRQQKLEQDKADAEEKIQEVKTVYLLVRLIYLDSKGVD